MNMLEFAKCALRYPDQYQLRTASGRIVEITKIATSESYPIRGIIKDAVPGHDVICEWNENGYPHNLPYTHGLTLLPYRAKTVYERIDENLFKSAINQKDLVN